MKCPKCGDRVKVRNTRTPEYKKRHENLDILMNDSLIQWAEDAVGWWTSDWVARERHCGCGWRSRSIELLEEDVDVLLKDGPA